MICPCCRQEMPDTPLKVSPEARAVSSPKGTVRVPQRVGEFIQVLNEAGNSGLPHERLMIRVLGGSFDNHYQAPDKMLQVYASHARKVLAPLGWTVENIHNYGYRLAAL